MTRLFIYFKLFSLFLSVIVNQSFYNKDTYGNPFACKHNAGDRKGNFTAPKMAAVDDFGGPKLSAPNRSQQNDLAPVIGWQVGDCCTAKYWEDGGYYRALVTAVTDKTCVVQFSGYGNVEEVLHADCKRVGNDGGSVPNAVATKPRNQRIRYFNRSKQ